MAVNQTHSKAKQRNQFQTISRRLNQALGMMVLVVIVSTLGFYLLNWPDKSLTNLLESLWDTMNLISTVGSLPDMTGVQKIWAIFIIVFGLSIILYAFGSLTALLTSGEILHVYERQKMNKQIASLHNHVIICGYGNTGKLIAEYLLDHDITIVIIEQNKDKAEEAIAQGYLTICDDCTSETVLENAGVQQARGLVASLDNDAASVFVVLTARGLKPDLHIVARANQAHTVKQLERAGADQVTVPSQIAAHQLANAAIRPELGDFLARAMHGQEVEMIQVHISDYNWMDGKSLRELQLPRKLDMLVFAMIPKGEAQIFNPNPDTVVNAGDLLLAVARRGGNQRLTEVTAFEKRHS